MEVQRIMNEIIKSAVRVKYGDNEHLSSERFMPFTCTAWFFMVTSLQNFLHITCINSF